MFKKLMNKIIMGTKCYLALRQKLQEVEKENQDIKTLFMIEYLENTKTKERTYRSLTLLKITEELNNIISSNKTKARKIIREVNKLIKKEEIINTEKRIKALCNEIIKGE